MLVEEGCKVDILIALFGMQHLIELHAQFERKEQLYF